MTHIKIKLTLRATMRLREESITFSLHFMIIIYKILGKIKNIDYECTFQKKIFFTFNKKCDISSVDKML